MENDSLLWYNVNEWSDFGLAVPNWSDDTHSQNSTINNLVQVCGRNLQAIMWHQDARMTSPPSMNTIFRIHQLCIRVRSILSGRAIQLNEFRMETKHAVPSPEVFTVFPTPYFKVRNKWLKEYAMYVLIALTEAMQHQENATTIDITVEFGKDFGQFFQRIYKLMATELLLVPEVEAEKKDFTLTEEQLKTYDPAKVITSTEMIDTVADIFRWPTEDKLKTITNGIPVTQLPDLGPWPNAAGTVAGSASANPSGASFF